MNGIPDTQKGWRAVRQGPPSKALAMQVFPVPRIREGEVLVKIEASQVASEPYVSAAKPIRDLANPSSSGYKLMSVLPSIIARRPHVAEHDFTGIVADAGTSDYKVGDAVFGEIPVPLQQKTGQGALAQYISIPTTLIALRPPSLVATQAAGIALAGVTAYHALFISMGIESGQHILINGGSSSVGSCAIQIAKAHGCTVTASCSTPNIDLVKGLGADEVIDYKVHPVHTYLTSNPPSPKFHGIFDCIGSTSQLFLRCPSYLAPSGKFVSVGPNFDKLSQLPSVLWSIIQTSALPRWLGGVPRHHEIVLSASNKKSALDALAKLVNDGQLRPLVDSVHSFDEVLDAYEKIMSHRAKGKVVVTIN
ncbi:hypothetical protein CTheo_2886 [Ceratobasidium theobromae]|uniref:Enoyl reductase (ER) domain-containing protein n=1 Tax=Ceratobasidium theobromae TaxID=1582974 RepID=A0A5N5QQ51_9AGAM|nr:hypothetical protein CTheo_2886 [Ceratobasidium theobromae]